MFRVTVLNGKQLIKYLVSTIMIICIVVGITRYFNAKRENKQIVVNETQKVISHPLNKCMETTIVSMRYMNKGNSETSNITLASSILGSELTLRNNIIEKSGLVINQEELTQDDADELINNFIPGDIVTQVIEDKNIKPSYNSSYQSVQIKNNTQYELTEDILMPDISLDNRKDIIIFHTHTCESYTPTEQYNYEMTGNYRTTDLNYSVARVGTELKAQLESRGYNVTHDTTYHDFPAYSGSYGRSMNTVSNILKSNNSQLVIDLHRDAIGDGSSYAPTVKINDEYAAQIMLVIGTDQGGLEHNNWRENLKFAIKLQAKANELYPGLFRPITLSTSRYNQHLAKGACIIEVGATGNTMEQCLVSMKYLASVIDECMK